MYGFLPSYRAMLDREGAEGPGRRCDRRRRIDRREESAGARRRRRDRVRRVDLRNHRGALTNARAPEVAVVTRTTVAPRTARSARRRGGRGHTRLAPPRDVHAARSAHAAVARTASSARRGRDLRRRHGRSARTGRRVVPRPRARLSRRRASRRCASDIASRTISRVACTTWRRPPISRAAPARDAMSSSGIRSAVRSQSRPGSCSAGIAAVSSRLSTQSAGCEHASELGDDSPAPVPRDRRRDPAARDEHCRADACRSRRGRAAAGHRPPAHASCRRSARTMRAWIPTRYRRASD